MTVAYSIGSFSFVADRRLQVYLTNMALIWIAMAGLLQIVAG